MTVLRYLKYLPMGLYRLLRSPDLMDGVHSMSSSVLGYKYFLDGTQQRGAGKGGGGGERRTRANGSEEKINGGVRRYIFIISYCVYDAQEGGTRLYLVGYRGKVKKRFQRKEQINKWNE